MILCFHREGAFPIKLEQSEGRGKLFRVTYGAQVHDGLTYLQAAKELGSCLMHCLACEDKLDNEGQ